MLFLSNFKGKGTLRNLKRPEQNTDNKRKKKAQVVNSKLKLQLNFHTIKQN